MNNLIQKMSQKYKRPLSMKAPLSLFFPLIVTLFFVSGETNDNVYSKYSGLSIPQLGTLHNSVQNALD